MYDENQSEFQRRVKVVLLPGADDTDIPADLRRATRYRVSDFTPDRMGDLPRVLHRSPRHVMPPLGPSRICRPMLVKGQTGVAGGVH